MAPVFWFASRFRGDGGAWQGTSSKNGREAEKKKKEVVCSFVHIAGTFIGVQAWGCWSTLLQDTQRYAHHRPCCWPPMRSAMAVPRNKAAAAPVLEYLWGGLLRRSNRLHLLRLHFVLKSFTVCFVVFTKKQIFLFKEAPNERSFLQTKIDLKMM